MRIQRKSCLLFSLVLFLVFIVLTILLHTKYKSDEQNGNNAANSNLALNLVHSYPHLLSFEYLNDTFSNINIVRTVGSANHAKVAQYIVTSLQNIGWTVEEHEHSENTIIGPKTFKNIIGKSQPDAQSYYVFACHYDSKLKPKGMPASIDSAMPCAMILGLAHLYSEYFTQANPSKLPMQVVFFDGEEAFEEWTDTDSLYGSKALASDLQKRYLPSGNNELSTWKLMILLDLLGASNTKLYDFGYSDKKYFDLLIRIEEDLLKSKALLSENSRGKPIFNSSKYYRNLSERDTTSSVIIQDDHYPFYKKGVAVLHLIPPGFPPQWHQIYDDAEHIDMHESLDLYRIFAGFMIKICSSSAESSYQTEI